jgi:ubiquinone/menaquinone biosynthesis C-methylase UbiE
MSHMPKQSPAELYEDYLVPGVHGRWTPLLLDYAKPEPGERVLDLACGTGIVARRIAPLLGSEGRIVGLDVSPDMLAVAERLPRPPGAPIEWQQGEASSLPDGPFDLVICQQGVQFFPDRLAALQATRRALRPQGRLVLNVFRELERQSLYDALFRAVAAHLSTPVERIATPYSLWDANELRTLLHEAGYEQVEITAETCMVRFPSPDRFVALTVSAAASVVPEFGADAAARAELIDAVRQQIGDLLHRHVEDDAVAFPMSSHIAVAR